MPRQSGFGWAWRVPLALAGSLAAATASGYLLTRGLPLDDPLERLYAGLFGALGVACCCLSAGCWRVIRATSPGAWAVACWYWAWRCGCWRGAVEVAGASSPALAARWRRRAVRRVAVRGAVQWRLESWPRRPARVAAGPGAGGRRSPCAGAPARTGGRGRRRHPRCDPAAARSRPCRLQRLRCAPGLPAGPRPGQRPGAATDAGAGPPAEPAQEPVRRLPRAGAGQPVRRIAVAAVPGRRAAAQPPLARPAALAAGSRAAPGAVRPAWPDRHLGTALAAVVRFHRRAQRAGRSRDPAAGAGGLPAGTEPGVRRVDGTAAARRRGGGHWRPASISTACLPAMPCGRPASSPSA
ncbi:protein fptB [Pseudomonas aeruginosa]|nr:protein fptB [Pseudomonas aeruginosa]